MNRVVSLARERRVWILGLLGVTAVWAWSMQSQGQTSVKPVEYEMLERRVETFGSVHPRESGTYFSPMEGTPAKVLWLIEEGARVTAGDPVARMDTYGSVEALRKSRLLLVTKRDARQAVEVKLEVDQAAGRRALEQLQGQIEVAIRGLSAYEGLEGPVERLELANGLIAAEHRRQEERQRVADVEEFLAKGYASESERQKGLRDLQGAEAAWTAASQKLRLFDEVLFPREIEKRRQAVVELDAKEAHTGEELGASARLARAEMATLDEEVNQLAERCAELEAQIAGAEVRAEGPGIVVHGDVYDQFAGKRKIRVGDLVHSDVVLLRVTNLEELDLVATVPETQIRGLETKLSARVWLSPDPQLEIPGSLRNVGSVGASDGEMDRGRSAQVRIEIRDAPDWIRPGMTGRASILVRRFEKALVVPFSAVIYDGRQPTVQVRSLFGWRRRPIVIGGTVQEGIVIAEGLEGGETILQDGASR